MTTSKGRLAGKTILVTGAGNGIGRGCTELFVREGAYVVAVDIDAEALADLDAVGQVHGGVDLVNEDEVDRLVRALPSLDVLVNAAAFAEFSWIEDMSFNSWRRTLTGELDIVFLVCRAAWSLLKKSGAASIVNFASANARHALDGSPALAHCAGKGGVLAMTRQLAMEGAPHGIRANTISPGFVLTAATRAHLERDPAVEAKVLGKNMLKRLGEPIDVAECALWLASDASGFVTGADFAVDGGATAW
jgi:NAD(P)-dependent dehydrogenase (short-subunit alcohol dehydrogenase family)